MLTLTNSPIFTIDDPIVQQFFQHYLPDLYETQSKTFAQKTANRIGRAAGNTKKFFSRTETKEATLLSYWAADSMVAVFLLMTTTNPVAITLSISLLALHTYATFSVVTEIMQ